MGFFKRFNPPSVVDRLVREVAELEHNLLTAVREKEHAEAQIGLYETRMKRAKLMLASLESVNTQKGVTRP